MVKIIGFSLKENKEGKTFVTLELQGDLVLVQSSETGKYYGTAKKCSITSTFDEEQANQLIGKEFPGRIEKVPCMEYDYVIPETGELIQLSHRWEYLPEGEATPLRVVSSEMV